MTDAHGNMTYARLLAAAEADHAEAVRLFKAGWNELQAAQTAITMRTDEKIRAERALRDAEDGPRAALAASLNAIDAIWRAMRADGEQHMIRVWEYRDAPEALQNLSPHGGDEDWVAWIPPTIRNHDPLWLDEGTSFGCCSVSRHPLPDGSTVHIGAHA